MSKQYDENYTYNLCLILIVYTHSIRQCSGLQSSFKIPTVCAGFCCSPAITHLIPLIISTNPLIRIRYVSTGTEQNPAQWVFRDMIEEHCINGIGMNYIKISLNPFTPSRQALNYCTRVCTVNHIFE